MKRCLLALVLVISSSQCWAWGTRGHETIETVASKLMPENDFSKLLKKNIRAVRYLAMAPDLSWKHGTTPHILEGEAHFFQMNFYSPHGQALNPDLKFYVDKDGEEAVVKKGTAPWRMAQMTSVLVNVLKKSKVSEVEVVQIAAALGHYVGDLGNPLHVAEDYDGVAIGQKGLHSFFETTTVETIPEDTLLEEVADAAEGNLKQIPSALNPLSGAFSLAIAANESSKTVLEDAKDLGLTPALQTKLKPIIITTLSASSAVLAKIWNAAYIAAGSPPLKIENLGKVPVPDWVPVNYIPGVKAE